MSVNALETRAHELLGQLNPSRLAAVVHLLEAIVSDETPIDQEPITEEEQRRLLEREAFFASGRGIPMEEVLAEFGLTLEDFPTSK